MFDSLNRGMLQPYGCDWTKTPNFLRLAEKAVTFDNCYAGSLPCMPARREMHTGRYNFLHRSWGPMEPYDDSLPELLKSHGVYSHLISDHAHYWEDGGCTYHTRYSSWEGERGQEGDPWKAQVKDPAVPDHYGRVWRQDIINRQVMDCEDKQSQTRCFRDGLEFLDTNRDQDNWFLQIEAFDPHEPYYTMDAYKKLYPHHYDGPQFDWPDYKKVDEPEDAVRHVRYEYAALLSMCDANLGKIIDYMDRYDMWKDTMLIVNTDHGFLLGEHDCWAKCVHPFYDEVAHIPFFVWDPRSGRKGERRKALVQSSVDIAPTLLNFFGINVPKDMEGKDLATTIATDIPVREACLFGMHGGQVNVTDGRYVYMRGFGKDNAPLNNYTLMPTHMRSMFSVDEMKTMKWHEPFSFTKECPVMEISCSTLSGKADLALSDNAGTVLYDLVTDPKQEHPIKDSAVEQRMLKLMRRLMEEDDAPSEQYQRLGI